MIYGDDARGIISSREFQTFDMAQKYRDLSERTELNFDAVIALMDRLPTFLNGENHKKNRKEMAKVYSASRPNQEKNVDAVLKEMRCMLEQLEGELDIIQEIGKPLWEAVTSAIMGNTIIDDGLTSDLPDLFYPNFSIRRRKALNDRLSAELDKISPSAREETLNKISVLVLGARPLMHSIALSIYKDSTKNVGKNLTNIKFSRSYSDSSLRFVDRIATEDTAINGYCLKSGSRMRCVSFDESYSEHDNTKYIFGSGRHLCLGRPIADYIWKKLVALLADLDKIVVPVTLTLANQEPFLIVKKSIIELKKPVVKS